MALQPNLRRISTNPECRWDWRMILFWKVQSSLISFSEFLAAPLSRTNCPRAGIRTTPKSRHGRPVEVCWTKKNGTSRLSFLLGNLESPLIIELLSFISLCLLTLSSTSISSYPLSQPPYPVWIERSSHPHEVVMYYLRLHSSPTSIPS